MKASSDRRDNRLWLLTFTIWGAGATLFLVADAFLPSAPVVVQAIGGPALYIVAGFYFLALWPIRHWLERRL